MAAAAGVRLEHLSRQWRIPSGSGESSPAGFDLLHKDDERQDPWQALKNDAAAQRSISVGPWSRSAVRGLAILVVSALLLAGWWWWAGRPRDAIAAPTVLATGAAMTGAEGEAASPAPIASASAAAGAVIVHVVGQVRRPGLVTLPVGSRVDDAITAAGGVTRPRAADSVNLARVLVDGEQVVVGFAAQAVAGVLGISPTKSAGKLNLNSADATAFEQLPGVGPVLAQRIIQWRVANGPFRTVDELGEVSGIGDAIMGQLRPLVTV